ncbi:MAG: ABC transporter permease [Theionarchaea archaeon]|nr:ABC transporter permease [Theionarchaea archaeon]MBU7001873.1 ABC transporter permease [Theionarchaea archaeon]MBU7022312.1 ABC transporter permease [Theionarchaea archaeon]MBU7035067.1 ABC transporter permease [Theionarchaea archaeon]MBU7040656.1 ABC transporter permease [Theionarchaea archaeon]
MGEEEKIKRRTRIQDVVHQMRKNKSAMFGLGLLMIIVVLCVGAPLFAPHDPHDVDLDRQLKPGFWSDDGLPGFYLGTDALGRDLLSRLFYGGRVTLSVGFVALGFAVGVGILMGVSAGYFGGIVDNIVMRIVDILFAYPALLLALVVAGTLGRGIDKAMLAIGIVYTPQMARVVRGAVLSIKETEYIEAEHAIGSSTWRIIFRHVLPNSMAPIIVYSTLMLATAILDAAALGFLGVGAQAPSPEWGLALSLSRKYLVTGAWWAATFPGIAILLSVISLNLLGDGLRDALDPRLKGGAKL